MSMTTRMVNGIQRDQWDMAAEDEMEADVPLDRVMADIRRELVLRVAKADREAHREIYDALQSE